MYVWATISDQMDLMASGCKSSLTAVRPEFTSGSRLVAALVSRTLDIVVSALALIIFALPMLFVAGLIRMDSRGPALYKQERVGLAGKAFVILKFRSMHVDAEMAGHAWARKADPRVTRLGAFLRRTRIDELPQFVNILRGEMTLVGPRPERPFFVSRLISEIPGFEWRTVVKPGLTGWAQIKQGYSASVEEARTKLAHDLYYIRHRSLLMDFRILIATAKVVFLGIGAR